MTFNPYFIEVVVSISGGPGIVQKEIKTEARIEYSSDPESDIEKAAEAAVASAKGAL